MKRHHYTQKRKQEVLARYASSQEHLKDILADEGIPKSTFTQWLREYDPTSRDGCLAFTPKNFRHLIRENQHLKDIISVLQESYCSPRAPIKERLTEAENLYKKYNVHLVCEALDISRSTFYNHIKRNQRNNAWFYLRREDLKKEIEKIFSDSNQIYGVRKITAALRSQGMVVSANLVRDLMREMGLISVRQYSKYVHNKELYQCKNYVRRFFETDAPNIVWVSDVTYFKLKDTPFYICAILDVFSRKVIAYSIGETNSSYLIKRTIRQAYNERCPGPGLIFHSDRGSNYKSKSVRSYLYTLGITQSFSKPHTPYDNAVMESFFATLKQEKLYRWKYRSVREFKESVAQYMNWYNNSRLHDYLGNIPPTIYESSYLSRFNDHKVKGQ